MKKKLWTIFAATISASLLAQDASNSAPVMQAPPPVPAAPEPAVTTPPPAAPAVETPAPATTPAPKPAAPKKKTAAKKPAAKKPFVELKTVPLVPGPAVVSANHVNVRSKAGLVGEVVTRMSNGTPVTVVEEIHLTKSGPEEPSAWAKILLPADTKVWLKSSYLDATKTVTAKTLNLRAGPGEAYGVVGTLKKGDVVQEIQVKGEWTQIQAPTNAYAFMAAQYLKQEEAPVVAATPTEPAPPATTLTETPGVAPAPTEPPATPEMPAAGIGEAPTNAAPVVEEPPPPRIVQREGIVRSAFSIQAPTRFELISPDNHKTINYLYPPTPNLDLTRYKGLHIIVTGEEGLDERWKNTPVITIQQIKVID
jgi:uncharacterized protein YgiM (DUF1202 family)